ncbi:MAG: fasciclin domain-containing protein [Geminicoccaceae bacterium]
MTKRLTLSTSLLLTTLAACGGSAPPQPIAEPDLLAVLKSRPSLTRFAEALETSGVASTLLSSGSYTIFAPIDRAVTGQLDDATIRHHILSTRVTFSDMAGESTSYDTLNFDEIEIDATEQIVVGSALMVESDINAANGVIHVIDRGQLATPGPERLIDQQPLEQGQQDQSTVPIPSDQTATTN